MNTLINRFFVKNEQKVDVPESGSEEKNRLLDFFYRKCSDTAQFRELYERINTFEIPQHEFMANLTLVQLYLEFENFLIYKDPRFIGSETAIRTLAKTEIPDIIFLEGFEPLYVNEKNQGVFLARLFLKSVLQNLIRDNKPEKLALDWIGVVENRFSLKPGLNIVERINLLRRLKECSFEIYSEIVQAFGTNYADDLFYRSFNNFITFYAHIKAVKSVNELVPDSTETTIETPIRKLITLKNNHSIKGVPSPLGEDQKVILENILDGFLLIDGSAQIIDYNNRSLNILGVSDAQLKRQTFLEYLPQTLSYQLKQDLRKNDSSIPNILIGKRFETVLENANGKTDHYEIVITNNYTEVADTYSVFLKNISNKKHMLEAIREAKVNAERTAKAKSTFLSNMSHEIRTPLNVILGLSEIIKKGQVEDEALLQKNIDGIDFSARNLLSIVDDILDFSKIEAGKLTIQSIDFNVRKVVENLADGFDIKALEKGLSLSLDMEDDVPNIVIGDQYRLNQILTNLIGNAIKFTKTGKITISVRLVSEENETLKLQFMVEDTGIGISKENLDRIFDSFYQVEHQESSKVTGTGLGLTITKELIHLQNGEFDARSIQDEGSVFECTLPFKRSKLKGLTDSIKTYVREDKKLEGLKVLVAEDNKMNQFYIKQLLNNLKVSVDIAENGQEAVDIFHNAKTNYDLILMDMHMPVMNGIEAISQIRKSNKEAINKVPIVACSADVFPEARKSAIKAGIDFYLTKPLSEEAVKEVLFWLISDEKFDPQLQLEKDVSTKTDAETQNRNVDINMLKETFDNDDEFIASLLEVFIQTTPEDYKSMRHCIDREYYARASSQAHKMKSSFMNLGMTVHGHHLQQIETNIIKKEGLAEAKKHVSAFNQLYTKALLEVNLLLIELRQK